MPPPVRPCFGNRTRLRIQAGMSGPISFAHVRLPRQGGTKYKQIMGFFKMTTHNNPPPNRAERTSWHPMLLTYLSLIMATIAGVAALATVPEVRFYLCHKHIYVFCRELEVTEAKMKMFAWYPKLLSLGPPRAATEPVSEYERLQDKYIMPGFIPNEEDRSYVFSKGSQQQWIFWDAQLRSNRSPGHPIKFDVYWTLYNETGAPLSFGSEPATWASNTPAMTITGTAYTTDSSGPLRVGHYEVVLKITGDQLSGKEIRGGFDVK